MSHEFRLVAAADPQALLRILGLFAQRWLVPTYVEAMKEGQLQQIILVVSTDTATAALLAAKLTEAVMVRHVQYSCLREQAERPAVRATASG